MSEENINALAEKMGWNANYEGEEKVTAEEFILRTQGINKQSSKDIASLKTTIGKLEGQIKEVATNTGKQVRQAVDQAKQRLLSERDEAIDNADKAKVKELDKEIEELGGTQAPPQGPPPDIQQDYDRVISKFTAENPWFNPESEGFDAYMRGQAVQVGTAIANGQPTIKADDLLVATMDQLKKMNPEFFSTPSNKPTYVGGTTRGAPKKETSWGKLVADEPEAKNVFDEYVKQGVFKDSDAEREKYAKDVLSN